MKKLFRSIWKFLVSLFAKKEKVYRKQKKIYVEELSAKSGRLYLRWRTQDKIANQCGRKRFEMYRTINPLKVLSKRNISNIYDAFYNGVKIIDKGVFIVEKDIN